MHDYFYLTVYLLLYPKPAQNKHGPTFIFYQYHRFITKKHASFILTFNVNILQTKIDN